MNNPTISPLLVLLAAVCFGTTGSAQALGPEADPLTVGATRIAVGGILLLLVARTVTKATAPWPRAELVTIAAIGAALVLAGLLTLAAPERRRKPRLAATTA